jgi:hypothetical protein
MIDRAGWSGGVELGPGTLAGVGESEPERSILERERALQAAMRASDVDELDKLLHAELLAVGPDGQLADIAVTLAALRLQF